MEEPVMKSTAEIEAINEADASILLSEPVTWTYVAIEIAKAVFAAAAKEALKNMFTKGINFENLLKNMLKEIDKIVTQRIDDAFITQATIAANTTDLAIRQYINAPNQERLNEIYRGSVSLVNSFAHYKHRTYSEYILAVSLHLFYLEEKFKTVPEEKDNIIQLLAIASDHIVDLNKGWKAISNNRFTIETTQVFAGPNDQRINIGSPAMTRAYYVAEGSRRISEINKKQDKIEQQFKQIQVDRYNSDVVDKYINPGLQVVKLWSKRIAQLQKLQ